jgi:hypothetical protein
LGSTKRPIIDLAGEPAPRLVRAGAALGVPQAFRYERHGDITTAELTVHAAISAARGAMALNIE